MTMLKTHYQVRFLAGRRGESHEFWVDSGQDLAKQIYEYMRPRFTGDFGVTVDLDRMEGTIGSFGVFKIERMR